MLIKLRSISREVVPVQLSGNVSIDPSAVIAPGVLLQAEANSQIKIGAGVCIGAGTIVHAYGGNLYIEAGVCLGRGVLVIGTGLVDRDACIGAGSTAIDPHIESGVVIPPHSLLGDRSRNTVSVVETSDIPENIATSNPVESETDDVWGTPPVDEPRPDPVPVVTPQAIEQPITESTSQPEPSPRSPPVTTIEHQPHHTVSGRTQFDKIKRALFPNSGSNDYTA